jgi:hypothetical protein
MTIDEIDKTKKELARDPDAVIAAERLYSTFKELVRAGFSPQEALLYLGTLVASLTHLKNQSRKLDQQNQKGA